MAWSQKFRKSEISLDTGDSASNAVAKRSVLFLLPSVVQNMCVWTMDFVSAAKNTLSPTVCEKVVPRLNGRISTITSSNEISWKLHTPPKWRAGCAPAWHQRFKLRSSMVTPWTIGRSCVSTRRTFQRRSATTKPNCCFFSSTLQGYINTCSMPSRTQRSEQRRHENICGKFIHNAIGSTRLH